MSNVIYIVSWSLYAKRDFSHEVHSRPFFSKENAQNFLNELFQKYVDTCKENNVTVYSMMDLITGKQDKPNKDLNDLNNCIFLNDLACNYKNLVYYDDTHQTIVDFTVSYSSEHLDEITE